MWEYNYNHSNELYHHGVKGMKWGVRKKNDSYNKNYTDKQRKRDRAFYGERGEKRINRKLNEGHSLQGARHYEVERKEKLERRQRKLKRGARKARNVLVGIGSMYLYDQIYLNGMMTDAVVGASKKALNKIGGAKMKELNINFNAKRKTSNSTSVVPDIIDNINTIEGAPPVMPDIKRLKWR